eukprot:scaffold44252_cov22-Tisochrysis_lutea.AAC.2
MGHRGLQHPAGAAAQSLAHDDFYFIGCSLSIPSVVRIIFFLVCAQTGHHGLLQPTGAAALSLMRGDVLSAQGGHRGLQPASVAQGGGQPELGRFLGEVSRHTQPAPEGIESCSSQGELLPISGVLGHREASAAVSPPYPLPFMPSDSPNESHGGQKCPARRETCAIRVPCIK